MLLTPIQESLRSFVITTESRLNYDEERTVKKWFDRKFTLDLPLWYFSGVFERLAGTPARIEELVRDIPEDFFKSNHGDQW